MRTRSKLRRAAVLGGAVVVVLVAGGCAPQLDRIELNVQETRDGMAELKAENTRTQQELTALTTMIRADRGLVGETDAQRTAFLAQLSRQIDQLEQLIRDNAQYTRDLSARVDLLASRSGVPTLGEYKPPARDAVADLPEEARTIYQAAELDRDRGNRELARAGYEEFLERFPRSELADDALYWMGAMAQDAGECEEALSHLGLLLSRFPQSERSPSALMKSAVCLDAIGEAAEATRMREELLARYPSSDEAGLVRAQSQER
ncbi:MAG: tetratricopeptide repeat protein [Candidatus Krumholzibacteriia bacterium]